MIDDITKSHGITQEIAAAFGNSTSSETDKDEVRKNNYFFFKLKK